MKGERKILIAFILNGGFALFELLGGAFTGSVAILSDALHDGYFNAKYSDMEKFVIMWENSASRVVTYDYFVNYIKEMQEIGIDKEEFELAKRTIFASNIKSFDSTGEIANNLIYNLFDGADILDAPDIISSIDYKYVSELLKSMYKEEYYTMSVVEPLKK